MDKTRADRAAMDLWSQGALGKGKLAHMLEQATDAGYWQSLSGAAPAAASMEEAPTLSGESLDEAVQHLRTRGYFRTQPVLAPEAVGRIRGRLEAVRAHGWPPIFALVYDELWRVFRTPSVAGLLRAHFGGDYWQASDFWAYWIDPKAGAAGWPPHTDRKTGGTRVAVWIPLTDATLDNGCMFVIPTDRMPEALPPNFLEWKSLTAVELTKLLHNVRPLPAAAGSLLGWKDDLIHWGGKSNDVAREPRISIAAEFLPRGELPTDFERPLSGDELPDFLTRLQVIGKMILYYRQFDPEAGKFAGLAIHLIGETLTS